MDPTRGLEKAKTSSTTLMPRKAKQETMATSVASNISFDIKSIELADLGKRRIEWANQSMPVLQSIRKDFIKSQPLKGIRISACLHRTSQTATLAITLPTARPHLVPSRPNP